MTTHSTSKIEGSLSDAELDLVTGGFGEILTSVRQQQVLAWKEELTAAYLANHPPRLGPFYPPR